MSRTITLNDAELAEIRDALDQVIEGAIDTMSDSDEGTEEHADNAAFIAEIKAILAKLG